MHPCLLEADSCLRSDVTTNSRRPQVIEKYSVAVMEETARCDSDMTARFPFFERELGGPEVVNEFREELPADAARRPGPTESVVGQA